MKVENEERMKNIAKVSGIKYKTYQFNPGYSTMNYKANQMGRHMLYIVVNNQPSNVVIVDVFSQAPG